MKATNDKHLDRLIEYCANDWKNKPWPAISDYPGLKANLTNIITRTIADVEAGNAGLYYDCLVDSLIAVLIYCYATQAINISLDYVKESIDKMLGGRYIEGTTLYQVLWQDIDDWVRANRQEPQREKF